MIGNEMLGNQEAFSDDIIKLIIYTKNKQTLFHKYHNRIEVHVSQKGTKLSNSSVLIYPRNNSK